MSKLIDATWIYPNKIFIIIMLILFIWDLITYYYKKGKNHTNFKGEIVGIGILGTFLGIVIALLDFDQSNIKSSIEPLLAGMKTAFITSVAGLFISITLTIIQSFIKSKYASNDNDQYSQAVKNLQDELIGFFEKNTKSNNNLTEQIKLTRQDQNDNSKKIQKTLDEKLTSMNTSLSNALDKISEENTKSYKIFTDQIKLAHHDQNNNSLKLQKTLDEKLTSMNDSLSKALEKISKGANEEIIKSLETVISNFNNNLQEQFGENFKELNDACKKLLVWQENYKTHVENIEKLLEKTTKRFNDVSDKYKHIATISENFNNAIPNITENTKQINKFTEQGTGLLNKLKESTKNLSKEIQTIQNSYKTRDEHFRKIVDKSESLIQNQATKIGEIQNEVKKSADNTRNEMDSALKNLNNALTSITNEFAEKYKQFLSVLNNNNNLS